MPVVSRSLAQVALNLRSLDLVVEEGELLTDWAAGPRRIRKKSLERLSPRPHGERPRPDLQKLAVPGWSVSFGPREDGDVLLAPEFLLGARPGPALAVIRAHDQRLVRQGVTSPPPWQSLEPKVSSL